MYYRRINTRYCRNNPTSNYVLRRRTNNNNYRNRKKYRNNYINSNKYNKNILNKYLYRIRFKRRTLLPNDLLRNSLWLWNEYYIKYGSSNINGSSNIIIPSKHYEKTTRSSTIINDSIPI